MALQLHQGAKIKYLSCGGINCYSRVPLVSYLTRVLVLHWRVHWSATVCTLCSLCPLCGVAVAIESEHVCLWETGLVFSSSVSFNDNIL